MNTDKIIVFTDNIHQYEYWLRENKIDRNYTRYVNNPDALRGLTPEFRYILVGDYEKNKAYCSTEFYSMRILPLNLQGVKNYIMEQKRKFDYERGYREKRYFELRDLMIEYLEIHSYVNIPTNKLRHQVQKSYIFS